MNKNDDFIVRYFDMKKENERINQSMLNAARREGHKSGVSEGIAEGRVLGHTEGSKQKEKEMVLNLYNSKIPIETIAKCANISRETVLKIVKAF